jgi:hypothetical protein
MPFGRFDVERGVYCSNDHFSDRFTCPGCYSDLEPPTKPADDGSETPVFMRCECGTPLRLTVEMFPSSIATVCDADEDEECDA